MDDDQKWLEAAAAIEQDIIYLKAAMVDSSQRNGIPLGLEQDILQLNMVLGIYRANAACGVAFPHPDDLFCISNLPHGATETSKTARRDLKASAF